jgi:hypothetical protein
MVIERLNGMHADAGRWLALQEDSLLDARVRLAELENDVDMQRRYIQELSTAVAVLQGQPPAGGSGAGGANTGDGGLPVINLGPEPNGQQE